MITANCYPLQGYTKLYEFVTISIITFMYFTQKKYVFTLGSKHKMQYIDYVL